VPEDFQVCLGQRMMMFRTTKDILSSYFRTVLISPIFVKQWRSKLVGTAAHHVNIGDLKKMFVPLPPLAEQKRIVAKVDELTALCDRLETSLEQADIENEQLLESVLFHVFNPGDAKV
jgi:type I restriction enzyme S subunit